MKHFKLRNLLLIFFGVMLMASLGISAGCRNRERFYTVSFDANGGTEVESVRVKENSPVGKLPVTSKDGFFFLGWADEAESKNANVNENYTITKDITFFAVFADENEELCAITFSTSGTSVENSKVRKGEAIGVLPFTDKLGYSFSGWFFDEELTKPVYSEDVITENVTLYAGFEKQDVESVLPEYTELSVSSNDVDFEIKFASDKAIDERNLESFISVASLYGELPKISVNSLSDGLYSLTPVGGYKNGGVYKIDLTSENVTFTELEAFYDDDYTDEKNIKTVYLSIETGDEETVSVKSGIIEINKSSVSFSENENKFTASEAVYSKLPLENGSTVRIVDNQNGDRYVKITETTQEGEKRVYSYADCETVDDVYEDFDINVGDVPVVNEMTVPENQSATNKALAEVADELYKSKGTEAVTAMLAGALNASPSLKRITGESKNPYKDEVSDVKGNSFTIKGLLDDLEINISLGTALNKNFNGIGISPFDDTRWTMLAISFNYETEIKNNLKLEATITITQYLYVGLASSANKSTGDFKAEITPYSQTDIDFKILVCSVSKDDKPDDKKEDKKEEKKDISVEIEKLASGEGDSSNIIADVREMLENKGDAIDLCKVPLFSASYTVGGVLSINFDLNFVIKVSFAAGIKIDATLLEATTIGVTGNYKKKTVDCYRRAAQGSDRYVFDFYAYGYLGLKAGIEGELTLSFTGLKQVFRAGVSLEVGAYADLYGYLHYHAEERRVFKDIDTNGKHYQSLEGGMYFESGIYIELGAFIGVGKKEFGKSAEFKFKLLEAGDKYLYVESSDNEDITIVFNENEDNSVSLDGLIPAEGTYMDITTGETETRVIPSKNTKLISNSNMFSVNSETNKLVANMDKITPRLAYGIPSGTLSVYYKGQNILFSSSYLNENIPELKGFKELCKVTVVYLPSGVSLDENTEFGKEVTVTYKVKTEDKEETVKTEKVISGQYYKGGIPEEIIEYCHINGLLSETDGNAVTYNGLPEGKHLVTEDVTFVFDTKEAQRFIAVRYKTKDDFESEDDVWTVDIMAMGYNETPTLLPEQQYTPSNVYYEYFVMTPDGNRKVMGEEYLSKYDLYMRGTHGYETGIVLCTVNGTLPEIEVIFDEMKKGDGELKEYSEFFTFTVQTEYVTGMHTVYFYSPNGDYTHDNVKYGETFKIPDYWINNINQSSSERLSGWDTDGDGNADLLPNQQFIVTRDMVLRPVMSALGYVLSVTDFNGEVKQYTLEAGKKLPDYILEEINTPLETDNGYSTDALSFYSESYRQIITSDFVEGDKGSVYFKGISFRYKEDITVMPACDVAITAVRGDLYHYVTLEDKTDGYYTYKNESGETVRSKTVKIAVKDGGTVGTSKDYNSKELKYHPPANVSYYASNYVSDEGEKLDFYYTVITKGKTYNHTTWERYDGTYSVCFDYYTYSEDGVSIENKYSFVNVTDEDRLNELLALCDEEYDKLTAPEYYDSLSDKEFAYTPLNDQNLKEYRSKDGYGITYVYYQVNVRKSHKTYAVNVKFGTESVGDYSTDVRYAEVFVAFGGLSKSVRYENEDGKFIAYYDLIGYDTDGDGIADVMPGDAIVVTKDVTFTAVWNSEPSSITFLGK